jgi:hypothetical protein
MDLNTTIDIIIKDLNDVHDIIDDLKKYQGIPVFQVELAKSKCKSAAEVIAILKDMIGKNEEVKSDVKSEAKGTVTARDEITEPVKEMKEDLAEQVTNPGMNPVVSIEEDTKIVIEHVRETETKALTPENIRIFPKKPAANPILADQFNNLGERINEKIGGLKHDDDISEILKNKPLSNLTEAIGINDRFLFIREIFNGNPETYNEAIDRLNSAGNIDEARNLITDYAQENSDTEAVRQLMDLMKRKFRSNE